MEQIAVEPVFWTRRGIISLGPEVLHELAQRASATTQAYKLVVGRCLLAVDETRLYEKFGHSSAIHYAVRVLGLAEKEAQELRRVAFCLEALPAMTRAAELGQVAWGKLREIVRKASPETEAVWLNLAGHKSCRQIEKLVAATEYGKLPWDEDQQTEPPMTRLQVRIKPETEALLERAVHNISQAAGKPMSVAETLEHLVVEHLARRPVDPTVLQAARQEARRGVAAQKVRNACLIAEARELASELGWDNADCPLEVALGGAGLDVWDGANQDLLPSGDEASSALESQPTSVEAFVPEVCSVVGERGRIDDCSGEGVAASNRTIVLASPDGEVLLSDPPSGSGSRALARILGGVPGKAACSGTGECSNGEGQAATGDGSTHVSVSKADVTEGADGDEARRGVGAEGRVDQVKDVQGSRSEDDGATRKVELIDVGQAELLELLESSQDELNGSRSDWMNKKLRYNPRARRATPAQRVELLRRDGHRCRTPGCPHRLWLELHHQVWYSKHGETIRANLLSLCTRCHANEQKGLLRIERDATGRLIFRDASGEDIERAFATRTADWINYRLGWSGSRHDFHRPVLARTG